MRENDCFKHLLQANFFFAHDTNAPEGAGRHSLAHVKKSAGLEKALHGYDFIMVVVRMTWTAATHDGREALIFHELCHCGGEYDKETDKFKAKIIPHEVEDFKAVVEKYGFWNQGLAYAREAFGKHFVQQELPLDGPQSPPPGPAAETTPSTQATQ